MATVHPDEFVEPQFEAILYHHIMVMSDAQGKGLDVLDEMVDTLEQIAMTQMTREERKMLRKFKVLMSVLRDILAEKYENELKQFRSDPYSEKHVFLRNKRDEDFEVFNAIYRDFKLRWIMACIRSVFSQGKSEIYGEDEFFNDLKIELTFSISLYFPFSEEEFEEALKEAEERVENGGT